MEDIYKQKSNWKWYLALMGLIIVSITMWYTQRLAEELMAEEVHKAEQFAAALEHLSAMEGDTMANYCDLSLHLAIIKDNTSIPVVLLNGNNKIEEYRNLTEDNKEEEMDTAIVRQYLSQMLMKNADTIKIKNDYFTKYLIYTHSAMLDRLKFYPYLQLLLVAGFIAFGYLTFSAARRSEQNLVWVGMAKETAHQLGTPISAILGWIENLKLLNEDDETNMEMLEELGKDVTRLELVADRFSKIGSVPELESRDVYTQLEHIKAYMAMRSPKRVVYEFPDIQEEEIPIQINAHLFDWVLENLIRNAIDAMETGQGTISATVSLDDTFVNIDLSDSGKGIPQNKFKSIFKPGFSTKKRGWGLGLSLSKRIIEEYHKGQIFVLGSEPNVQTTFRIRLPK